MNHSILPHKNRKLLLAAVALLFTCTGCGASGCAGPRAKDYFRDPDLIAMANAVKSGDLKTIDQLVANGVDVNAKGTRGVTLSQFAIKCRRKPSLKKLLEHGANPNLQNENGDSAVSIAAGDREDSEYLAIVLKHKGNPNLVDPKGNFEFGNNRTPIYMAIDSRRIKNLELLLDAGAKPHHQDKSGQTPAMFAATCRWYEGVLRLLKAGADFRAKNENGHDLAFIVFLSDVDKKHFPEKSKRRESVLAFLKDKGVDLKKAERLAKAHMGRK